MVARLVRDQEVVGSSPVTSTTKRRKVNPFAFLLNQAGFEPTTSLKTGPPKIAEKRDFWGEERPSAKVWRRNKNCGADGKARGATRVQVPSPRPQKGER